MTFQSFLFLTSIFREIASYTQDLQDNQANALFTLSRMSEGVSFTFLTLLTSYPHQPVTFCSCNLLYLFIFDNPTISCVRQVEFFQLSKKYTEAQHNIILRHNIIRMLKRFRSKPPQGSHLLCDITTFSAATGSVHRRSHLQLSSYPPSRISYGKTNPGLQLLSHCNGLTVVHV